MSTVTDSNKCIKYYQVKGLCTQRYKSDVSDITCDYKNIIYESESKVLDALKNEYKKEYYDEKSGLFCPTISELKECKDSIGVF
jgi:hypothetical protein